MNKNKCSSCGETKCSCKNKDFTKAVIEINNPEQITLMRRVVIPASMGDDTTVPPAVGKYKNVLLYYEANSKSYLYSSDGIPTQLVNGFTDYEEAINLPQINGVTLMGDKSSADLKLADAPLVITVANGNTSWSGADTAEDVYDFFLNKGKVNIIFNGEENYSYEIASAAYIPGEEKMMCTLAVATIAAGETAEFEGNALFGTMTLYTADKAIDVSQIELQPKLFVADFTGLDLYDNELSGLPATTYSIGMVKPGDGLEVASDGTLSISDIEQYAHFFDTVADMKAATNLKAGDYARTAGFYAIDDGGEALYHITDTGTANEMDVVAVGDLFAVLVCNKEIKVKQFGAKGDGVTDETAILQRAIDYTSTNKGSLFIADGTYMVDATTNIFLKSNMKLVFANAKIKAIPNNQTTYNVLSVIGCQNCVIDDAVIEGERDEHLGSTGEFGYGVNIRGETKNVVFNNLTVNNCWGDGIFFYRTRVGSTDYIPEGVYFNGVTTISNCRRQGVTILAAKSIYFDVLNITKIDGTDPMAAIDLEGEHSVDLLGDIYINTLKCSQTKKAFTMRTSAPIVGDIHIGTILHENPIGYTTAAGTGYEPSFRVMYEYFSIDQAKYSVSVDNVYSERGCLQLENLYNDATPKTIIGNVHTKEKTHFYAEAAASGRALLNINYPLTTDVSNSLGNLFVDSITIDKVGVIESGQTLNDFSVVKVYYSGNTALNSLKFENVRIGRIEAITKGTGINFGSSISNVLFNNSYFSSINIQNVYERRDSGTFTHITSGGNTIYFMPASDATTSKTIQLRPRNTLQPLKLKCVGNSTVTINTAHQSTYFTGVKLNGTDLTGTDNVYTIGTFSTGAEFNIYTDNGVIIVEQTN